MSRPSWLFREILAGFVGAALVAGCGDRGEETSRRMESPDTAMSRSQPSDSAAASAGQLSDANIVGLLDEANMADSSSGAYALGKATNAEVKAFAKLMMG